MTHELLPPIVHRLVFSNYLLLHPILLLAHSYKHSYTSLSYHPDVLYIHIVYIIIYGLNAKQRYSKILQPIMPPFPLPTTPHSRASS
jgi:hypothetical protein